MKPTKKAAKKKFKAARHSQKRATLSLTPGDRSRLLKPVTDYEELVRKTLDTWPRFAASLRIPGLNAAKLRALLARAERAQRVEKKIEESVETRLRAARDARLVADDRAYRALLDLRAIAEVTSRRDAALGSAFEFLFKAIGGKRTAPAPATATTVS